LAPFFGSFAECTGVGFAGLAAVLRLLLLVWAGDRSLTVAARLVAARFVAVDFALVAGADWGADFFVPPAEARDRLGVSSMTAWAAANRATGTRNGLHET